MKTPCTTITIQALIDAVIIITGAETTVVDHVQEIVVNQLVVNQFVMIVVQDTEEDATHVVNAVEKVLNSSQSIKFSSIRIFCFFS